MATIKKTILLALTALTMVGCENSNSQTPIDTNTSIQYKTAIIDSCEYVIGYYRLAHKGDCRFCKERRQKELEELVEQIKEK